MEDTKKTNYITLLKNFLNTTIGIGLIIGTFQLLGNNFMLSYLSYFNIDISLYKINLFKDFTYFFSALTIISIPFLMSMLSSYIIYNIFKIVIKERDIKITKKIDVVKPVIIFLLITIGLPFLGYFLIKFSFSVELRVILIYYYTFLSITLSITIVICFLKWLFKDVKGEGDMMDLIFILIILLYSIIFINSKVIYYGEKFARDQKTFKIIDKNYIVLYNTEDYTIVSKYKYEQKTNSIDIYTNELIKTDIKDKIIAYKTFNKVKIIK